MDYSDSSKYTSSRSYIGDDPREDPIIIADEDFAKENKVISFLDLYGKAPDKSSSLGGNNTYEHFRVMAEQADEFFHNALDTRVQYGEETFYLGDVRWRDLKQNLEDKGFNTKV